MPDNLTKLAQIISNGLVILGNKIDSLIVTIKNQKAPTQRDIQVQIPPIRLPEFPAIPPIEIPPAPPIDTTGIERAIKEGLGKNKYPIVNVPKQEAPIVNIPAPIVNVEPAKVEFPKEMEVKGIKEIKEGIEAIVNREEKNPFDGISHKKPLPMIILDSAGKQVNNFGGDMTAPSVVGIKMGTTQVSSADPLSVTDGMNIPAWDYVSLSYTGSNLTGVIFKTGGSGGTTVATLVLAYTGDNLISVTKT